MRRHEQGFTILELLIATTVVSVVLLLVSVMMINIGNLYYKGITQAKIQDNVRSITDDLSQHLQLSGHAPVFLVSDDTTTHVLCLGDTRYTYILGKQIGTDPNQIKHVLWRDTVDTGSCPTPKDDDHKLFVPNNFFLNIALGGATQIYGASTGTSGSELIAPHSRLVDLSVSPTSPYNVVIKVAYGDDDLLCAPSLAVNSCTTGSVSNLEIATKDLKCKGQQGDSFCATANLTTTVVQRLK